MFQSIDATLQRYADTLAAKSSDAAAFLQQTFWPKEDPDAAAWREALQNVRCIATLLGREEIPIYFQLLPPLQPISLFSYYQGMQLQSRVLPSTIIRLGALALVDYYFPSRPWIRRLTYTLSATILMFEIFPSLTWPLLHNTIFVVLKMRNVLFPTQLSPSFQ